MKRLASMFLAATMFLGIGMNVQAGGRDETIILDDGTELIYVPTDKIEAKATEFAEKAKELLEKRYTTKKNLAIRGIATSVATAGFYVSSQLSEEYPAAALCGQALSLILGIAGFFYPDYRDYELGKEFCGRDGRAGYSWKFGPDEGIGIAHINSCFLNPNPNGEGWVLRNDECGIVIVIRPESKRFLQKDYDSFCSGVYSQDDIDKVMYGGKKGLSGLEILKKCIERGK